MKSTKNKHTLIASLVLTVFVSALGPSLRWTQAAVVCDPSVYDFFAYFLGVTCPGTSYSATTGFFRFISGTPSTTIPTSTIPSTSVPSSALVRSVTPTGTEGRYDPDVERVLRGSIGGLTTEEMGRLARSYDDPPSSVAPSGGLEPLSALSHVVGTFTTETSRSPGGEDTVTVELPPALWTTEWPGITADYVYWSPEDNRARPGGRQSHTQRRMEASQIRIRLIPGLRPPAAIVEFGQPGEYIVNGRPVRIAEGRTSDQLASDLEERDRSQIPLQSGELVDPGEYAQISAPSAAGERNRTANLHLGNLTPGQRFRMETYSVERVDSSRYMFHIFSPGNFYVRGYNNLSPVHFEREFHVGPGGETVDAPAL